jgi:hypothetical protein
MPSALSQIKKPRSLPEPISLEPADLHETEAADVDTAMKVAVSYFSARPVESPLVVRQPDQVLARAAVVDAHALAKAARKQAESASTSTIATRRRTYSTGFSLDSYPLLARACRLLFGATVAGSVVAAGVTAGPGNYHALSQPAKAAATATAVPVALPRVVIVGQRQAPTGKP